jgi:anti-anti-sigma regulatory factor
MTGWDDAPVAADQGNGGADSDVVLADVPDAAALLRQLQAHHAGSQLRVLADQVQRLGTAALQVLVTAMTEADAAGRRVIVVSPSFAFSLAFESFGFGADNEPFIVEFA